MKVKKLIEKLSKVDPELSVASSEFGGEFYSADVEHVLLTEYMGRIVVELTSDFPERWVEYKKSWEAMKPVYKVKEII